MHSEWSNNVWKNKSAQKHFATQKYINKTSASKNNLLLQSLDELNSNINNVIVFDDLMIECLKSEPVMNLFTVGSHHKNTGVFFITQNIFSKGKFARDISLNANYMIIFHNPRDQMQFQMLARQMFPNNSNFLTESFNDATKKPHGYLYLDLKKSTEMKNRIQTSILPGQLRIIYTQK